MARRAGAARRAGLIIDATLVVGLLALGLCIGFLAGLLGIGGGMLMVPFLTFVIAQRGAPAQLAVKMAIATSMGTILFTSLASLRAHHRHGAVRWELVRRLAPGIVAGGLAAGAGAFALLKGAFLSLLFALFIGFSATQMLRRPRAPSSHRMPGVAGQFAAGGAIGFLSGLVGAGGAFASVPIMNWWGVPIHNATATSAALGFPIALAATLGYVIGGWSLPATVPGAFGYLYVPGLIVIACASVVAAPFGARLAHRLDTRQLRRMFAVLLYALGLYMLAHALRGQ
jgi:uncharacterized membrane protein YfcA